jgi:hypothetical protein
MCLSKGLRLLPLDPKRTKRTNAGAEKQVVTFDYFYTRRTNRARYTTTDGAAGMFWVDLDCLRQSWSSHQNCKLVITHAYVR